MTNTKTSEQVTGERIKQMRISRGLTQAALIEAMQALGHSWHQTTASKTEAAGRPLRVNELTDIARVLNVPVSSLLAPLGPNDMSFGAYSLQLCQALNAAGSIQAYLAELEVQANRAYEDLGRVQQLARDAEDGLKDLGAVQVNGAWRLAPQNA